MHKRQSGILMHVTSLPSPYGVGDLGPCAFDFVDFLTAAGQKFWQMLPINPTDGINGNSPYSCFSAFAGNPLLISLEGMVKEGLLRPSDLKSSPGFDEPTVVDYPRATAFKEKLFKKAHNHFQKVKNKSDFEIFVREHDYWLQDFALFTVIKSLHEGHGWHEWPKPLRERQPAALKDFARKHANEIEKHKFIQFLFFHQWHGLKSYANAKGAQIIGDIPIYVNYDSVEVWCHRSFFKIDKEGRLKFVSGCPPDYFSRTGQRWGNPVYDWSQLKKSKYSWWVKRIKHNLHLFDYLRIDHFRGFESFWQIPAHEKLAVFGRWVKGPDAAFFKVLAAELKPLPIIAEDLGEITPRVVELMHQFGFPGMRVLLFGFNGDPQDNPHAPDNYPVHCVAYTGTHDNNTIQGWYHHEAKPHERANIGKVLHAKIRPAQLHWTMISALMHSKAQTVVVPLQDFLGLGEATRMNTPATKVNNWQWRLKPGMLTGSLGRKILLMTRRSKRG